MSQKPSVRITAITIAIMFFFSFIPCIPASADIMYVNTSPFIDVNTSHWSIHNVIEMNIRGVVSGYTDGTFQPNKPVTQLEAVLMAVRNLNASDEIDQVSNSRSLPIDVPSWAVQSYKKELLFAIDQGYIQTSEGSFDASTYASRAWMAKLMVRMIEKESEASQLSNQATGFTDDTSIPIWAIGYVNVAVKYDLVSGYPDNSFKPFNNITRAETVTLLSRSEQYLPLGDQTITGRIISISNDTFVINVNGNNTNITMNAATWGFDEAGKVSSWTTLNVGDNIKCILEDNIVRYAEKLPATAIASSLRATVLHVMPAERVLVAKDTNGVILTRTLSTSTLITNQVGEGFLLNQLEENSEVELSMDSSGNLLSVILLTQQGNFSNSGIIYAINSDQKLIVLKNSQNQFVSYQYNDDLQVKINGVRFPGLADLQIGDQVKLVLAEGVLQEVELMQAQQQLSLSAKIALISNQKRLITIESNGAPQSYYLADQIQIVIPGVDYPVLSDLQVDDEVDLQITEGKISSISVKNRVGDNSLQGTIVAVDTSEKILVITTTAGEIKNYEFSDAAEIDINNISSPTLSDLKVDMEVEFQLLNDKIIYLESKNGVEGTVVSVNEDRHLLVLRLATGESRTYILSSNPDVNIQDVSSPDLGDIQKNDLVNVSIEDDLVTDIDVEQTLLYEVIYVYDSSNKLKVEDEDGDNKYLYLYSRVNLLIPGISSPDTGDFEEGDLVRATYMGNTLETVELSPRSCGKITDINTFTKKVSLQEFDGSITTYTFDAYSKVIDGSYTSTQLSALAIGDRVEISENIFNHLQFSLMSLVSGKFVSNDDDYEKIYITKDYSSSYENYYLSSDCYIHLGNQTKMLRNIDKDDRLDLYLLNGRVYEIDLK